MPSPARATIVALLCAAIVAATASSVESQSVAPIEIPAIVSTTGYLAFVGKGEARSLQVLEGVVNKGGGINGRPVKFDILDAQSNPQVGLQLVNDLIAKKVPAFIGPDTTAGCKAVYPIVQTTGPVMYCLSPGLAPSAGSFAFSAQVNSHAILVDTMRFFKAHGWTRVAMITTTDANGQDLTQGYGETLALPEFRTLQSVALEHFNGTDLTVDAQIARIKAAAPQALIAWVAGTPFGTVAHAIHDSGLNVPVVTIAINANPAQLKDLSAILPTPLYFPSNQGTVLGDTPPGAARTAQNVYFGAYKDLSLTPAAIDAIPWDAGMLLVGAYRKLGADASPARIRDWILAQTNWGGVFGIYNFTDGSQRGLSDRNALMFVWDPANASMVAVSKAGGAL